MASNGHHSDFLSAAFDSQHRGGGPLGRGHLEEARPVSPGELAREGEVLDPDIASRPGPRIVDALEQMAHILHPDRVP